MRNIIISILIVFALGGILYGAQQLFFKKTEQVVCTQEVKLCPDGSYVGRTGLNCEFAQCPPILSSPFFSQNLKNFTDSKTGISFQYPEKITAKYIRTVDWPPQVQVLNEAFVCTEGGQEIARAGITKRIAIGDRIYCVTKESQGAAGSIYTQYAYAFPKGNETIIFTFSLQFPQCGNYPNPQQTECENERLLFNPDIVADQIARSIR